MLILDAAATAAALPFDRLVPALRRRFAEGCEMPPRMVLDLAGPQAHAPVTSLVMPAWVPGRCYVVKVINIAPGNAARGLPGLHATVLLHDAATGVPLALIDGNALTAARTAAASALAASFLTPTDLDGLLVVGAGRVAAQLPAAYRAVRPLRRVRCWARRPEAARAQVKAWRGEGFDAEAVTDLEAAVRASPATACATLAATPVIRGEWLAAGSHLDLIGSFTPAMREADDACWQGARVLIDDHEALRKSGDLIGPLASGALREAQLAGTLAEACRGELAPAGATPHHTVFKSVGLALEDLAAAMLAAGLDG